MPYSVRMKEVSARFTQISQSFTTEKGHTFSFTEQTGPYDFLLGALSGCLYRTFESIAQKMRLEWGEVSLHIRGTFREEKVTTLKTCTITAQISEAKDREKLTSAFEKATRYCSIYQTLSGVAEMKWELEYA